MVTFGFVGEVTVKYLHRVGGDGVEVVEGGSPLTVTAFKKMSEFLCMVCISLLLPFSAHANDIGLSHAVSVIRANSYILFFFLLI